MAVNCFQGVIWLSSGTELNFRVIVASGRVKITSAKASIFILSSFHLRSIGRLYFHQRAVAIIREEAHRAKRAHFKGLFRSPQRCCDVQ